MKKQITIIKGDLKEVNFVINVRKNDDNLYTVSCSSEEEIFPPKTVSFRDLEDTVMDFEKHIYASYADGDHIKLLKDIGFIFSSERIPGDEFTKEQREMDRAMNILMHGLPQDKWEEVRHIVRSVPGLKNPITALKQ